METLALLSKKSTICVSWLCAIDGYSCLLSLRASTILIRLFKLIYFLGGNNTGELKHLMQFVQMTGLDHGFDRTFETIKERKHPHGRYGTLHVAISQ